MVVRRNEVLWVDFIRVVATLAVIWLHSASSLLYYYNEISVVNWWTANVFDSVARMCVPLFFMLTGYLLLDRQESLGDFFSRRIHKVVVPLIVWTIIYMLWKWRFENGEAPSLYGLEKSIFTPVYYHLWFLYAIIGIYLYMPILRVFFQNSSPTLQIYFMALWFIAVAGIQFGEEISQVKSSFDLKMISGYVGYLLVGRFLGTIKITNRHIIIALVTVVISNLVTILATYFLVVQNNGVYVGYFREFLSPNIILMSAAVFILLKQGCEKAGFFTAVPVVNVIKIMSRASLGMYLVHPIVFYSLEKGYLGFKLSVFLYNGLYSIPVTAIAVGILSFLIIIIWQKIPLLNKCVP
jgi:surface polysaccharide O-acyltransferase-like enzyme